MLPNNCGRVGSVVIIKNEISRYEDIKIEKAEFQVTSAKIKTATSLNTVAAIYSLLRHNVKREDYLNLPQSFSAKFILGGDFNCQNTHWGSRLTTTKGSEPYHAIKRHNCEVHTTGKPTYWPTDRNKKPDLINFFVSRNLSSSFTDVTEEIDLDSAHSPIFLTLSETIIKKRLKTNSIEQTN